MNKPLKTVEGTLNEKVVCPQCHFSHQLGDADFARIKREVYQLMLSLVGEDEGVVSADDIEDFDVHRLAVERTKIGRNKLKAELRKKLSEHFNVEGEI